MANELIQELFNKSIRELTKEDLVEFFQTERQENDILEFKTYIDEQTPGTDKLSRDKKKLLELIITICGFLNSDGGVLIWGCPKGKKVGGKKERSYQGEIRPVEYLLEQEQFINKVTSEISPVPLRVKFHPINFANDTYCYVFEVVRSEFGPHQCKGTYYMRMDGSTHTAPHYFVEALIKKITFPRIEVFLLFGPLNEFIADYAAIPMQLAVHNLSKYTPEKNIQVRILCDYADIVSINRETVPNLKGGADLLSEKIELLHYRVAHIEHYAILFRRFSGGTQILRVSTFANGELSPVITSTYTIEVFTNRSNLHLSYRILGKEENVYLSDLPKVKDLSDREVVENSNAANFASFESNLHKMSLYKTLWNKTNNE